MDPGQQAYAAWCVHARAFLPWEELEPSDRDAWRAFAQFLATEHGVMFAPTD